MVSAKNNFVEHSDEKLIPTPCVNLWPGFLRICGVVFAVAISVCSTGCSRPVKTGVPRAIYLRDRLMLIDDGKSENLNRAMPVTRRGERREALVLIAPVKVRADLSGLRGEMLLTGFVTPVFNMGDGVTVEIFLVRDGMRQKIGQRDFNAARRAEDRSWIPVEFPLSLTEDNVLEIELSGGPQGDLVADWLAFDSLRLISQKTGA